MEKDEPYILRSANRKNIAPLSANSKKVKFVELSSSLDKQTDVNKINPGRILKRRNTATCAVAQTESMNNNIGAKIRTAIQLEEKMDKLETEKKN